MNSQKITYVDQVALREKTILLRVDFNVTITDTLTIADDARIRQSLPTLMYLLTNHNKIILVSHLDRPKGRDPKLSLRIVADHLQNLIPEYRVHLVDDFQSEAGKEQLSKQIYKDVMMLENIRFYEGEQVCDDAFAKELASLADVYVNDAFGVSHRKDASLYRVPSYLPSYGGLLLKKETETIGKLLKSPKKPFVAILGGAKISTKIKLIQRLIEIADFVLLGGGLANTFFVAQGYEIGKSLVERHQIESAKEILQYAKDKKTEIILPSDVIVGDSKNQEHGGQVESVTNIQPDQAILDIGPETQAHFGSIIAKAKTIIWNGPVGYNENKQYCRGTDFLYYAITHNPNCLSIVGGGDTLASISKKEYLGKITHISTGGGAMLEFIEQGTLPGIDALKGRGTKDIL